MASVYELGNGLDTLWNLIEDETVEDEALLDAFENITDDLKVKFENCCKYIKNTDTLIDGLDAEIKRLQARKKALENGEKRLKAMMLDVQKKSGEKKLECGTFTTTVQANPEKVIVDVDDVYAIPEDYLKYSEPEVNKTAVKKALQSGEQFTWAHLEKTDGLRIR